MKLLDKYILKTFTITFTTVFVILFFIFILQTVWLFIFELAGKDLDFGLIIKFLLFSMPRIIPLVLPLSVLLASIMTFGNFAENYEFAAMKSSGISLQRAMRSLIFFIVLLSGLAFIFANNVIPFAEYKFINFRKNIAQRKPAMAIAEGQFSEIGIYTIKVDKKEGKEGNLLKGVTIHKKSVQKNDVSTIIKAKSGELVSSESSNILKLILNDGYYYEDIVPKKYEDRYKVPFAKASFKKDIINLDLSFLNPKNEDQNVTTNSMLNVNELNYTLDSLHKSYNKDLISFAENINQRTRVTNYNLNVTNPIVKIKTEVKPNTDLVSLFTLPEKGQLLDVASSNISNALFSINSSNDEMKFKRKNINNHWLALYDKFVVAYACILMFFIGAPLGAIIRKGGIGLPIVFAVLIFITFHFINTFGKRMSQEDGLNPFWGAWMASIVLTPLAISLTYRATNDIGLINLDILLKPFRKLFQKLFPTEK